MNKIRQNFQLIRDLPKAILGWYPFSAGNTVLYIGTEEETIAELLVEIGLRVVCASVAQTCELSWQQTHVTAFDYIIAIASLEQEHSPLNALKVWRVQLKPDGKLLLGMNNRFGIRYFCGDRDPYTERSFDGVEGYRRAYDKKEDVFRGRSYSQAELRDLLRNADWHNFQFYSVFSDLNNPNLIYAEDYLPNEDLATRVFSTYNYPDTVFLEEESLYDSLIANGMFHKMANAYLIECTLDGILSDVSHVTSSLERGREHAVYTMIHKSGTVEKRAAYPEGQGRLEKLVANCEDLRDHGIAVVETRMEQGACVMPYIEAEVGQVYLKRLLQTDKEKFLQKMDHFRDLILKSSDIVKSDDGDGQGVILRKGYLDMMPLNSFYIDGTFVFYDQEFCEENYPANVILTRMVRAFYTGNAELNKIIPMQDLFERYGLTKNLDHWQVMGWNFLTDLRKERELRIYHEKYRRNPDTVNANRQRMNYSESEYQRLFVDVFKNAKSKKLVLFGSGNFADRFLGMFGREYPVHSIIDNNESKWGKRLQGVLISSPALFGELDPNECKVIVCIKNYLSVIKQLETLGIRDYSVFDPGKVYSRETQIAVVSVEEKDVKPKKYHIGYVAGVFDMFHVGHVNLLRRAKELCDYLIVGVVPDETVYRQKGKYPVIPCEDRVEVIRACRYADRVEALSDQYASIRDAYRLFHFDVQFSGDDHGENIDWIADRDFLAKNGADIVFFPYTEKVSSSKLREQLRINES